MSPGPTFDRVYVWLKDRLVSGTLTPGAELEPAHLTDQLATSITPIRDALHRLAGERLVDASWGKGFRVPAPTEADLRTLYGWNHTLLDAAIRSTGGRHEERDQDDVLPLTMPILARAIAGRGGAEHVAAVSSVTDRLGAARAAEMSVLGDTSGEVEALGQAFWSGDHRLLRRGLAAYHRRRIRAVSEIVVAMRATGSEQR